MSAFSPERQLSGTAPAPAPPSGSGSAGACLSSSQHHHTTTMARPPTVPMGISTTDEYYQSHRSSSNNNNKSLGFLPRNYTGRRQIVVAGSCFLLFLVILQTAVTNRSAEDVDVVEESSSK
mmetsp:Transcript_34113/g.82044  ORF Transcript_34113/g.82044 Transcript_34113/m.82044 type:complete len:121 (+) Transcript_34113:63-425(+)